MRLLLAESPESGASGLLRTTTERPLLRPNICCWLPILAVYFVASRSSFRFGVLTPSESGSGNMPQLRIDMLYCLIDLIIARRNSQILDHLVNQVGRILQQPRIVHVQMIRRPKELFF